MPKTNEIETEDLIELGVASIETRGGALVQIFDNPQSDRKNEPGLAAD